MHRLLIRFFTLLTRGPGDRRTGPRLLITPKGGFGRVADIEASTRAAEITFIAPPATNALLSAEWRGRLDVVDRRHSTHQMIRCVQCFFSLLLYNQEQHLIQKAFMNIRVDTHHNRLIPSV